MKAVRYEHTGPAHEVLQVVDIPTPEPGPGEVRVKVVYSGVNPTDWKSRSGATSRPSAGRHTPHHDGSGVIDAVGAGVDEARIGQRVWVYLAAAGRPWGTAAEWTVVPAENAVPLPDGTSFELGASLGIPALTAYRCLFADGGIATLPVLVSGGAGAVGHFAIELAKHAGARVAATVSNPEKAELARRAGADLVVNYREPDAQDRLRAFAAHMARIVEVNLAVNLPLDITLADASTVIVSYAADAPDPTLPVRACMTANVVLRFVLLFTTRADALRAAVAGVNDALAANALSALPVQRLPLDQCAAAHDAVQAGAVGKVLLQVAASA
jgi:NADPH2:quinone reductase